MKIGSNLHKCQKVEIGSKYYPVIFTHVGISSSPKNIEEETKLELKKAKSAIKYGANVICDVSMNDDLVKFQELLVRELNVPVGAVSIYETFIKANSDNFKIEDFISIIEEECIRGLDVLTIHATVFKEDKKLLKESERYIPTTSRGGMLMLELLERYNIENPYYTHFEEILKICKKYDVSISLGPCYRPASVADAYVDDLHLLELKRMAKLCDLAIKCEVNIMIEGIGHAPINKIEGIIAKSKQICHNVPYRVMPVSTDIAIGYDHISSAIASSVAVMYGADSVTVVTRSEHLGIPTYDEVIEGVMCTKVAVYSGYIARTNDLSKDIEMAKSRKNVGCLGNIDCCLFPELVIKYKTENPSEMCTMCGKYCPLNKQRKMI